MSILNKIGFAYSLGREASVLESKLATTKPVIVEEASDLDRAWESIQGAYNCWETRLKEIPKPCGALERIMYRIGYETGMGHDGAGTVRALLKEQIAEHYLI